MTERTNEAAFEVVCEPHHFVWTWPIEGGRGSVGVCDLCGAVTTGERDTTKRAEAFDDAADLLRDFRETFQEHERASILSGETAIRMLARTLRTPPASPSPEPPTGDGEREGVGRRG